MKIRILNSDSFGVRSMATVVETEEIKILIDPGAALGPRRYGLPPAEEEKWELERALDQIAKEADDSDIIIITHYHFDHYVPEGEFYKGKELIVKHATLNINWSQKKRAYAFFKHLRRLGIKPVQTNGGHFTFGNMKLEISPPFPHGFEGTKLGYVFMIAIFEGEEGFIFTSDVQGPVSDKAKVWIISRKPNIVFVDGPPTYLMGYRVEEASIVKGLENLMDLSKHVGKVIVDHHLLRDLRYREFLGSNSEIITGAEYMGYEIKMLEAHRKELWEKSRE